MNLSYESYAGQNVEELIKKFGDTYLDEYKTIPKYISGYEIEPDFTLYFSKEELDNEVVVRHVVWKFSTSTIQVWAKYENDVWVVFDSIKYGKCVRF
ncbi:MAG: hypothetical protein P1P64_10260 [Treponemataceae bacterium]